MRAATAANSTDLIPASLGERLWSNLYRPDMPHLEQGSTRRHWGQEAVSRRPGEAPEMVCLRFSPTS